MCVQIFIFYLFTCSLKDLTRNTTCFYITDILIHKTNCRKRQKINYWHPTEISSNEIKGFYILVHLCFNMICKVYQMFERHVSFFLPRVRFVHSPVKRGPMAPIVIQPVVAITTRPAIPRLERVSVQLGT